MASLEAIGGAAFFPALITLVGLLIVVFIIWKLGKIIFGIISNTILGLIVLYLLNSLLGAGISYDTPVIVVTAIFGMAGIAVLLVLKWLGVTV